MLPLCTKFQVSISTCFRDTLGRTPKVMGPRDIDHEPFLDLSFGFCSIVTVRLCTKFQVYISTRFGDMLTRYQIHCSAHIIGQKT